MLVFHPFDDAVYTWFVNKNNGLWSKHYLCNCMNILSMVLRTVVKHEQGISPTREHNSGISSNFTETQKNRSFKDPCKNVC